MSDTYKICFLGYKKLGELAHQVIEHLNYSDTTIILKECSIETLVQAVNEAISEAKGPRAIQPFSGKSYNASAAQLVDQLNIGTLTVKTE